MIAPVVAATCYREAGLALEIVVIDCLGSKTVSRFCSFKSGAGYVVVVTPHAAMFEERFDKIKTESQISG